MSVQIDNALFAMGIVSLSNPPALGRQSGFLEGTLTRVSIGLFRLQTVQPIDTDDGTITVSLATGAALGCSGQILDLETNGPNNIILHGYDPTTGDPADVGGVYVTLHRFPTVS